MVAISAEGNGNRFVVIAMQTSKQVPFDTDFTTKCRHVTFQAGKLSGVFDVVDAPRIRDAQTLGTNQQTQAKVGAKDVAHQLFKYVASVGDLVVNVNASPVMLRNQPSPPVDLERAWRLLSDSVSTIRGY